MLLNFYVVLLSVAQGRGRYGQFDLVLKAKSSFFSINLFRKKAMKLLAEHLKAEKTCMYNEILKMRNSIIFL